MSAQPSFLSIAHHKKLRCEKFLDEMEQVMPWTAMLDAIAPCIGSLTETLKKPTTDNRR